MNSLAEAGMTLRASPPSSLPTAIRVPPLPFREMACSSPPPNRPPAGHPSLPPARPRHGRHSGEKDIALGGGKNPCVPHINEPGPSALKPIWKPNSTSTPSTAPASDIGRAPRAPSSAGWKIRRIRPRRCRRIETSTSAKPSPTAACPSVRTRASDRANVMRTLAHGPMALFRALGDFVAVHIEPERRHGAGAAIQIRPEPRIAVPHARNQLGIGSMLKRTLPRRRKDSGRRDAHPPVGAQAASPMRIAYPSSRNRLMIKAAVRNSVQPASGWAWKSRRHAASLGTQRKRAMQKRQRGNRHRRYLTGTSRPPNGYNKKW